MKSKTNRADAFSYYLSFVESKDHKLLLRKECLLFKFFFENCYVSAFDIKTCTEVKIFRNCQYYVERYHHEN